MMNTEEEKKLPYVEEEKDVNKEEDDAEETGAEGGKSSDDEEEEEEEGGSDKEEESPPCPADERNPSPVLVEETKKQADVLNLNNEVVRMRKEVKRVKALVIRKLARQIAVLKKKKGKEAEVERNQRRAERLLEEVHCMKKLSPDLVTKTALQKNLNFEQVFKNPKSSISDRAVARIATHPQFNKKIESIKAAVKSFKEEHTKVGKHGRNAKVETHSEKATLPSPDKREGKKNLKKQKAVQPQEDANSEVGVFKITEDSTPAKAAEEMEKTSDIVEVHQKEIESGSVQSPSVKSPSKKDTLKHKPQSKAEENISDVQSAPEVLQKQVVEEESDLELSDNEKRDYFDDSTEERFHRQSSQSEESDEDDFFLGKVSKFKKKKQQQTGIEGEKKKADKGQEEKKESTDKVRTSDKLQSELDELESRLKSKSTALQTVFCSSLAGSKSTDRGRGGGIFKGQGKPQHGRGVNRDYFSKQSKFQKQEKGISNSGSKYNKPCPEDSWLGSDQKGGRGRGRGRDIQRQKDHRGGRVFAHQPPLHPSWEASKKRKEQQGQILAFQGKKIKFDDDD